MCELMGMSFDQPVVAEFSLRDFRCRDEENPDGWGLAWYPDRSLSLVKEAVTWRSSGYSKFLEGYQRLRARIYIAHVRKKTTGGPPTHADTHPFGREHLGRDYCFAHNGTIFASQALPLGAYAPIGQTDSERVFCHLLDAMNAVGERLADDRGWEWLHERLRDVNRLGTLNCLLSDGRRLFAYRDRHGWKGLSLRKVRFNNRGERTFEDATTEVSVEGNTENRGCIVATRALSAEGWHEVGKGSLVVLEGGSIAATIDATCCRA